MLSVLISILGIFITIFFVIGTHEAAHFLTAKWLGVKVLRFSIGFGKTLWRKTDKLGTEYVIALIPLGGYVKMLDEREGEVAPAEKQRAFNQQAYYKKMLIVLAGPFINIFCALIIYWAIFMIGFTTIKPIIGTITPNSIAARAGLKPDQEITMVDRRVANNWTSILIRLLSHAGNQDTLTLRTKFRESVQAHTLDLSSWQLDGLSPDPLQSIGISPYFPKVPLVIGQFSDHAPAANTLKLGDEIVAINEQPINTWEELIKTIENKPEQTLLFTIQRDGKTLKLPVVIGSKYQWWRKTGFLGISPEFNLPDEALNHIQYGPIPALQQAGQQLYDFVYFNFLLIGKLLVGKISLQSLGGPIAIFESAGTALNIGIVSFLAFLAFISITIGVINLLPIPGLDGGHLLFQTVEKIIGRDIPESVLSIFYRLGFALILFILSIALVNDLLRLTQ